MRKSRSAAGVGGAIPRVAVIALTMLTGCVGNLDPTGEGPVASLTVAEVDLALPWPEFADVELRLTPSRELPFEAGSPTLFVHLSSPEGRLIRTFDQGWQGDWTPGEERLVNVRLYQSALAEPLPAGDYALTAGLYDAAVGRYELSSSLPEAGRRELRLGTVRVPAESDRRPATLSGGWSPSEQGWDIQVLARRRLPGLRPGRIELPGANGAAELWLRLGLAAAPGEWMAMEQRAEDASPWVRVSGPCVVTPAEIEVEREMSLTADLEPAADGRCELELESNVFAAGPPAGTSYGPSLEVLSWRRRTE